MENKLNTKLFIRGGYKLELSEMGKELYDNLNNDLCNLETKIDDLVNNRDDLNGIITVVLPPIFAEVFIIPFLSEFYDQYPRITINLFYDFQDLSNYEFNFDVAVTTVFPRKDYFVIRKLFSENTFLCASPSYLKKHSHIEIKTLNDLYKHKVFIPKLQSMIYSNWKFFNRTTGKEEYLIFDNLHGMFDNSYAAVSLAKTGAGICPLLKFVANKYIKTGELERILPDYNLEDLDYYIVKPNEFKNKRVAAFLEFMDYCMNKSKANEE